MECQEYSGHYNGYLSNRRSGASRRGLEQRKFLHGALYRRLYQSRVCLGTKSNRVLPNFPGGHNGFATGANNLRQAVGWAENGVHDGACVSPQVLRFLPAMWALGPPDLIQDLPLFPGDTSGAATAINDNGQIVGISGICDQAVGRHTAKHAVLWENGGVTDIYPNAPAPWWNTPTAINQRGDVVGFAGDPAFVEGDILHAFM